MPSTNNSLACYGEGLQVVIGEPPCSIRIHQLSSETHINSSSRLVVGSYRWHQCIDRNNQPSIHQTPITKPPYFYAIGTIRQPLDGDLCDDWNSGPCFRRRACQPHCGIQCCLREVVSGLLSNCIVP